MDQKKSFKVGQLVKRKADTKGLALSVLRVIAVGTDHVYTCPWEECRRGTDGLPECYWEHKSWGKEELE